MTITLTDVLNRYRERRNAGALILTVCGTLLALILRRPDQWWAPAIWIEEGTVALPDFVANGWSSLVHPMMGYLVLPTKVILALAATVSFRWLPEVENVLNYAFTAGVLAAIAFSPTLLRHRLSCALVLLLLPTDSEVYGTAAYAFWWGSILIVLPLLWQPAAGRPLLRSALLIVGGLSSPLVLTLSPLFALRAALQRNRAAFADLALVGATSLVQATFVMKTAQAANTAYSVLTPALFVRKFFGYFLDPPPAVGVHDVPTLLVGVTLLAFLVACAARFRRELGPAYYYLMGAFLLAAIASVARVPITAIHPAVAGPRYFFLPFAFLLMALVQLAAIHIRLVQIALIAVVTLVARNAIDLGQRHHEPLDWRAAVTACIGAERGDLPVHWDGHSATAWKVSLTGADCRRLVGRSWFDNTLPAGAMP